MCVPVCAVACASRKTPHTTLHPIFCFLYGAEASTYFTYQKKRQETEVTSIHKQIAFYENDEKNGIKTGTACITKKRAGWAT